MVMLRQALRSCVVLLSAMVSQGQAPDRRLDPTPQDYHAPFPNEAHVCNGKEVVRVSCTEQPCDDCIPQNCVWSDWTGWETEPGCNGLAIRKRGVATDNNRCGSPCDGPMIESKRVPQPESCSSTDPVDCMLSEWGAWSQCKSSVDQSSRIRRVRVPAFNGGKACEGDMNETKPCGNPISGETACSFSDWHDWTECSISCGGGWKTRYRRIAQKSGYKGKPCAGIMSQIDTCKTATCPSNEPCILNEWAEWVGCDDTDPHQKIRDRTVKQYASGSGAPCNGYTRETEGCIKVNGTDATDAPCTLEDWAAWGECSVSCGGGQKTRYRRLKEPAKGLGTCPADSLQETEPCKEEGCSTDEGCKFTDWEDWSMCLPSCGKGIKTRRRHTDSPAVFVAGCDGVMKEVEACDSAPCVITDCQWGLWQEWTGCTTSCGGGTKRRSRVIEKSPRHGGRLCLENSKTQLEPCNTQSCDGGCQNATWGDWGPWSTCPVTCGKGYEMRERMVAQEASSSCGKPVSGLMEEFRGCTAINCTASVDCKMSDWSDWSSCSCSCFGIREKHRVIEVFPTEGGVQCQNAPLKMIEACNPGTGEAPAHECDATPARDCTLEDWGDWSSCPVTCGGGQSVRQRQVLAPASHSGKPCSVDLAMTRPCNKNMCRRHVENCHWGMWSEWGACTKCNGQRWRSRTIMQQPNQFGKPCEPKSGKEVSNCTGDCSGEVYCTWTGWSDYTECTAECGPAQRKRQRSLGLQVTKPAHGYLFEGHAPLVCTGTVFDTIACPTKPCEAKCVARPCVFNSWSEWSDSACTGLCTRSRTVREMNNECAPPCSGSTIESKQCPTHCDHPMDCELHDWGAWTRCRSINGQSIRSRGIKQMPQAGGNTCNGTHLSETKPCRTSTTPTDCSYQDWSVWSRCSVSCGVGWQMRNRNFHPGTRGGVGCQGSLKELQPCNLQSCGEPRACVIADWTEFSECHANGQKTRTRAITQTAIPPGTACTGSLAEVLPCGGETTDCVLSSWTSWDKCDKACDGGQQQRHRQISVYPTNGGLKCDKDLVQTRGCNTQCCGKGNCEAYDWTDWSNCDANCGPGQSTRVRTVKQFRSPKGEGCDFPLNETRPCHGSSNVEGCHTAADCRWADWFDWSACSCSCGGGQKFRRRNIAKSAEAGGAPCEALSREEAVPCNTQSCCKHPDGKDGHWADWGGWTECTAKYGPGVRWRNRVHADQANDYGHPAIGHSQEVEACTGTEGGGKDVDCLFSEWYDWSGCSPTCNGKKLRSRSIKQHGRGKGKFCEGALQETWPCNPASKIEGDNTSGFEDPPKACPQPGQSRDCRYSFWTSWGECSASCGGGQESRARVITTPALGDGKACNESLRETRGCSTQLCDGAEHPVPCTWADWGNWGACDKCGGQRIRSRSIKTHSLNGGPACAPSGGQETAGCPRKCKELSFCIWGEWGPYSDCSVTCGSGMKSRARSLKAVTETELSTHELERLSESYGLKLPQLTRSQDVPVQPALSKAKRMQALSYAFLAGASTIIMVLFVSRSISRWRQSSSHLVGYEPTALSEDTTLTSLD